MMMMMMMMMLMWFVKCFQKKATPRSEDSSPRPTADSAGDRLLRPCSPPADETPAAETTQASTDHGEYPVIPDPASTLLTRF